METEHGPGAPTDDELWLENLISRARAEDAAKAVEYLEENADQLLALRREFRGAPVGIVSTPFLYTIR